MGVLLLWKKRWTISLKQPSNILQHAALLQLLICYILFRPKYWCVVCCLIASEKCQAEQHDTQPYDLLFMQSFKAIKKRFNKLAPDLDQIISNRKKVQDVYENIYDSISSLQSLLEMYIAANTSSVEKAISFKREALDFKRLAPNKYFSDEYRIIAMNRQKELATRYLFYLRT